MEPTSKYYFDKQAAEHCVKWIEKYITHAQGDMKGKPLVLADFQKEDLIYPLFGTKHKITKFRRYKTVFLFIPKKNAKSTLAAAISLYLLMGLKAVGVNIICAAADRSQAGIIFNDLASVMVEQNRTLSKPGMAEVFRNSIVYKGRAFKVISSEAKTKHGFIPYGIVIDEVHAHKNKELIDTLRTGVVGRDEPIVFYLTTAGTDTSSVAFELYEYAKKVKSGEIIDETFLPVLYEADKDLDIFEESTWRIANPGFGTMVKKHYFVEETNKIRNQPSYESAFRRLHLNQWVGAEETWISDQDWMKGTGSDLTKIVDGLIVQTIQGKELFSYIEKRLQQLKRRKCYLGMDLASVRDLCALTAIFPNEDGDSYENFSWYWLPSKAMKERIKSIDVNFQEYVDWGFLTITPGDVTDYNSIADKIFWLFENYDVQMLGYDPHNSSKLIVDLQTEGGISLDRMEPVSQYLSKISSSTKEWERLIIMGKMIHYGNPILRWMNGNVRIKTDRNANIGVERGDTRRKNVDGIVSGIIALDSALAFDDDDPNLVYSGNVDI